MSVDLFKWTGDLGPFPVGTICFSRRPRTEKKVGNQSFLEFLSCIERAPDGSKSEPESRPFKITMKIEF